MDLPFDGWRRFQYLLMRCNEWRTACAFVQCAFWVECDWKGLCRRRRQCRRQHLPSIPQNRRIHQMFASRQCTPATSAWSTLIFASPLPYTQFLCVSLHNKHIKSIIKYIHFALCGIDGRWSWMHFWFACDCHSMRRLSSTCNETTWEKKWS